MNQAMFTLAVAFPLGLFAPIAASADTLNLDKVKCGEWLSAPPDSIGMTLAWMNGYYMDEDADPVIDFDKLGADAKKLAEACKANPDKMLGGVAEELFAKK